MIFFSNLVDDEDSLEYLRLKLYFVSSTKKFQYITISSMKCLKNFSKCINDFENVNNK